MCSEVNPVGKPCAADPHARFDERGWETGLYATAPVLDSTGHANDGLWPHGAAIFMLCVWLCCVYLVPSI